MTRALRLGLLVAGALAACLAVLWACVVLGLWLALHAPLMGMLAFATVGLVVATLLVDEVRDQERRW